MGAFLGKKLTIDMGRGAFFGENLTHKHGGLYRYKFNA